MFTFNCPRRFYRALPTAATGPFSFVLGLRRKYEMNKLDIIRKIPIILFMVGFQLLCLGPFMWFLYALVMGRDGNFDSDFWMAVSVFMALTLQILSIVSIFIIGIMKNGPVFGLPAILLILLFEIAVIYIKINEFIKYCANILINGGTT